jgi:SAM-dependent methyltransferase
LFLGIFLTSAATLTLQISLIRLLSVAQGYHFAFLVVSMALLGYGASGSFLSAFPSFLRGEAPPFLARVTGLFSCCALAAYLISNQIPFDLARMAWDPWQIFYIFLYYLAFSVPFFFSGLALSCAMSRWSASSGKIYFADLGGASLGCLLVLALFGVFGGEGTLLFSALLGAVASMVFGRMGHPRSFLPWVWAGFLTLLLVWQPPFFSLRLSPYKALSFALRFPGARLLETRWNHFSRVDILRSPAARTAPGMSLENLEPLPPQVALAVDAGALSAITHFEGRPEQSEDLKFLDFLPSSFPYELVRPERVLILDPGGGMEVLNALRHGTREITAVEINPIIVDLLQGPYSGYSGRIYQRKRVQVMVAGARSFIRRNPPPFDLITFPLTDSLGASSTGFFGLQEDYRLTTEALQECFKILKPGGFLAFSFYLLPPPRAELRLTSVAKAVLKQTGRNPAEHLLAFRSWATFSLLIKKEPLTSLDIQGLKSFCQRLRFDIVYYPGITPGETNVHNRFPAPLYFTGIQSILGENPDVSSTYPFDVSPVTDDRPFFHYYFQWGGMEEIYRLAGEKWQILVEGGFLVPVVFLLALTLSLFFIFLPLILGKIFKSEGPPVSRIPWMVYFLALGFGFMSVEISLIQKFILFLGHPVYSVSLVIFSLLIFAGLGSRLSTGMDLQRPRGPRMALLAVAFLLFLSALYLPALMSSFQGEPRLVRQAVAVFLIAPLGLFMGMPFPLGIRLLGARQPLLVPWAWCANGCASVLGAILPVIVALTWGFQAVFFLAGLLYLLSFALLEIQLKNKAVYGKV